MSSFSVVVQATHSALIDELNERFPNEKPTLGLPATFSGFGAPRALSQEKFTLLICAVLVPPSAKGLFAIALSEEFEKVLDVTAEQFWDQMQKRAEKAFRAIPTSASFGTPKRLDFSNPLPQGIPLPSRMLWFPIEVGKAALYLGAGV